MLLCGRRYAGAKRLSDEPNGTRGRLNGISRAHTAGRALDGTSGQGGELHGSSEVAGGELDETNDSGDELEGTSGRLSGSVGPHRGWGAGWNQRPGR